MDKIRKILGKVFLFALLLVCISCVSLDVDKAQITEGHVVPDWFEEPQKSARWNTTAFVGKGVSVSKRQAELLSYTELCSGISDYTGSELGEIDYREISTKGTLDEYGLKITKTFVTYNGATYAYYILAVAENDALASHRSAGVVEYYNKLERIESSILSGDQCMIAGDYVGAIRNYIDSMCVSYGMSGVDDEYSFDAIFSEIKSVLSIMYFSVRNQRQNTGDIQMVMRIDEGVIPYNIPGSEVAVKYSVTDVKGSEYFEQYVMVTDSKGRVTFSPQSFGVASGSTVSFSLNLDSDIEKLRKVNASAAEELKQMADSCTYSYTYTTDYSMGPVLIAGLDYGINGDFFESHISTEYLVGQFSHNGAVSSSYFVTSDMTDEEILKEAQENYRGFGCLLVVRIAVTGTIDSSTGTVIAFAEGNAKLLRISDGAVLYETEIINSNGIGESREEAYADAFRTVSEVAYNIIRTEYV